MRVQQILCPTDFSASAGSALEVAARLARSHGSELVLAHVWHQPPLPTEAEYPMPAALGDLLIEDARSQLAGAARRAATLGVDRVQTRFLVGSPWDRIVALLHDEPRFELVVMGSNGHAAGRFPFGSIAERVVRHAPCSVLVTRDTRPFRHVLCPVDFSAASRFASRLAGDLVEPDGKLALLYAIELPVSYAAADSMTEFVRDLDVRSTRLLDELATRVRAEVAVPVTTEIRVGSPGAQTLAALDKDPTYDLVVLGSHGRTGLRRALLGSVAEKVVRHAACSVLVARART